MSNEPLIYHVHVSRGWPSMLETVTPLHEARVYAKRQTDCERYPYWIELDDDVRFPVSAEQFAALEPGDTIDLIPRLKEPSS